MTRPRVVLALIVGLVGSAGAVALGANSCVDCHQRAETVTALPAWYQDQFIHWYGSVHGRKGVTCEKCHGGNPSHMSKKLAHKDVKSSRDRLSPIYYKNIPETCGACHEAVYHQFVQSRHYKNLKADRLAPTCTTCHGFQMDIGGVAPLQIVGRCQMCHNPQQGVKPEVGNLARQTIAGIAEAEHTIRTAEMAVELAREQGREQKGAEQLLSRARDRLKKTGELWHNFKLGAFKQELIGIQKLAGEASAAAKRALLKK